MQPTPPHPENYAALLGEVKQRIRAAQLRALRQANTELITLYLDLGQLITQRQEGGTWGKAVVETLARDLQAEFPGTAGFSAANLWRMRQFWEAYGKNEKLAPLVREIGWSHNVVILEQCKDPLEREFYLRMTRKFGWTRNLLRHQIETDAYRRTVRNQTNFLDTLPPELQAQARLAVKDEYTFHFLELEDEHSERELERALTRRLPEFLREMGGRFTFVGTQYRLELNDKEYFVDLLLYHRRLRCLVAVDLLCGGPHKRSSVASHLMWRSGRAAGIFECRVVATPHNCRQAPFRSRSGCIFWPDRRLGRGRVSQYPDARKVDARMTFRADRLA